jgi:small basic protein
VILPVLGLVLGFAIGCVFPVVIPFAYAKLFSVALLASLDSVFGGLRAAFSGHFDNTVFISGFFTNALLAAFLVFVGDRLGIDLYYVALLTFGFRIFKNLAILRRHFLKKHGLEHPHLPDE